MTRVAISKSVRFEVFKRDRFICAYCGAHPPNVVLECDHIHPVAEGGSNDMDNLITACEPCNRGKAARLLTDVPKSLSERAFEVQEREEQIAGYETIMRERRQRIDDDAQHVLNEICERLGRQSIPRADFNSILRFIELLGLSEALEAVDIAAARFPRSYTKQFRYFCGVCWRKIRQMDGVDG